MNKYQSFLLFIFVFFIYFINIDDRGKNAFAIDIQAENIDEDIDQKSHLVDFTLTHNNFIENTENSILDSMLFEINMKITENWSVYSANSTEGYPMKITLNDKSDKIIQEINVIWPEAHEKIDYIIHQEIKSHIYKDIVKIPIILKLNTKEYNIRELSLENFSNFLSTLNLVLNINYGACGEGCVIGQEEVRYNHLDSYLQNRSNNTNSFYSIPASDALLRLKSEQQTENSLQKQENFAEFSIIIIMIFAILGGLILNMMPCVLPIVSLKIFHLIKYSRLPKKEIRLNLLLISLGIFLFFWFLAGITVFLKKIGLSVGWGMHFQEPIFISIFIVILLLFSLNMLGLFELSLPVTMNSKLAKIGMNSIHLQNLFSGFLISALATPCTAPFLSIAIAFAITKDATTIYIVYSCIALGMAIPYSTITAFPQAIKMLPKPGAWMEKFRKIMSIPMLATACWLLYILYTQIGLHCLWLIVNGLIIISLLFLRKLNFYFRSTFAVVISIFFLTRIHYGTIQSDVGSLEQLENYLHGEQIVFVNITADWCLTCKFNEALVINDNEIQSIFDSYQVILLRADYTKKSHYITAYLSEHKRYGIPLSVIYGPGAKAGIVLPEILNKQVLIEAIKKAM